MPGFEAGPNEKGFEEDKELSAMELHNTGLHDQDEDSAGEKVDLATGKKYDHSTETDLMHLSIIAGDKSSADALGALPEKEDAAAKWLREHDEDNFKKAA